MSIANETELTLFLSRGDVSDVVQFQPLLQHNSDWAQIIDCGAMRLVLKILRGMSFSLKIYINSHQVKPLA